jgi:hypothetical protein
MDWRFDRSPDENHQEMPMIRKYCHALAAAAAVACMAAPAAMATDEPPPPAPPGPTAPAPVAPTVTPNACTDKVAPSSKLGTTSRSAQHTHLLRGKSVDLGCGVGGSGSVARVNVSVALKSGSKCRFLGSSHKLGKATSCTRAHYLSAHGTGSWSYRLPKRLPKGSYRVSTRAVDSAGNVGSSSSQRLRLR